MSEPNPYRDEADHPPAPQEPAEQSRDDFDRKSARAERESAAEDSGGGNDSGAGGGQENSGGSGSDTGGAPTQNGGDMTISQGGNPRQNYPQGGGRPDRQDGRNGRRHRRGRGRGPRRDQPQNQGQNQGHGQGPGQGQQQQQQSQGPIAVVATSETRGWFDSARDGGYIRRPGTSYLAEAGDAWVPPHLVRQYGLRRADLINAGVGTDPRGRSIVADVRTINDIPAGEIGIRPEFNSLTASYPERKLFLETGRSAKGGHELTRRAIDLIAPIGYGQRALIVAPARAGKTTLLHAITEGVAINHPKAELLILLVDERPEEVSEAISWGVGEVVSSSFDQPAQRHVEVTEMVLARAHRLVEQGRDVVIVLDSLTRMARAHNTAERGSGRTLSGGLDATSMAKPKAFFGSARNIPESSGGGSLTIISTALVETGSRMDDVIFEEFKGTGNCEIKLDRSLAEKRIYPAIDIGTSGTRREEKLFRADQLDAVFTLRRGLSQMPPQSAMEWLIKRIAATPSNDQLLAGL
jgi:transcription termination factor Rho